MVENNLHIYKPTIKYLILKKYKSKNKLFDVKINYFFNYVL
ncbi:hypothetical protein BC670_2332 [Flavobacterium branchiophilum]|uniref:Uncharacterized protein n=1 Tax=Flavobacterium branchiophilum TaxID=55197 RepID=A0A543G5L6_9FLAO|nr:hypothetical protein BC670_2332 [Flavobacterium branchiophilum]